MRAGLRLASPGLESVNRLPPGLKWAKQFLSELDSMVVSEQELASELLTELQAELQTELIQASG